MTLYEISKHALKYTKERPTGQPRRISHILALSWNDVIGVRRPSEEMDMPWGMTLKKDMQFFRKQTSGNIVIMGRNTFETLGFKPLNDRINIVISSSIEANEYDHENLLIARSIDEAIHMAWELSEYAGCDIFIMGGATIYKQTYPFISHAYITRVHTIYLEDAENELIRLKLPYTDDFRVIENVGSYESENGEMYGIEILEKNRG